MEHGSLNRLEGSENKIDQGIMNRMEGSGKNMEEGSLNRLEIGSGNLDDLTNMVWQTQNDFGLEYFNMDQYLFTPTLDNASVNSNFFGSGYCYSNNLGRSSQTQEMARREEQDLEPVEEQVDEKEKKVTVKLAVAARAEDEVKDLGSKKKNGQPRPGKAKKKPVRKRTIKIKCPICGSRIVQAGLPKHFKLLHRRFIPSSLTLIGKIKV